MSEPKADLFSVFTVGHEVNYDQGIIEYGKKFKKLGRRKDYSGGYAVRSAEDAEKLIDEHGKRGEWAVYALAADWEKDTVPSENGWWHALVKSSLVVCKISSLRTQDGVLSCVRSRDGWCALRDQRQTAYRDSMETKCGMFVTLPWGIERREPDCEECRKAANSITNNPGAPIHPIKK